MEILGTSTRALQCLNAPLAHKISVYVPATVDVAQEADNGAEVQNTAALLSRLFGGATAQSVKGFWLSDTFGLVSENTVVVYAFASEGDFDAHLTEVIDACHLLKIRMSQEAIALEIDGKMYFV